MNAAAIRQIDVLSLSNVVDCEILISECDHAIQQIDEDIENQFGDEDWEYRAKRARAEIEHKKNLVAKKMDSLKTT